MGNSKLYIYECNFFYIFIVTVIVNKTSSFDVLAAFCCSRRDSLIVDTIAVIKAMVYRFRVIRDCGAKQYIFLLWVLLFTKRNS